MATGESNPDAGSTEQVTWFDPELGSQQHCAVRYQHSSLGITAECNGVLVALQQPVMLDRVAIDKPWGQELWYTGMEQRGQSQVQGQGGSLPLAQYLALAPKLLCDSLTPVLLKILDPDPANHLGDLYFELHQQKQEVYVVTQVDREAWPSGTGAIRLGINPEVRSTYKDDDALRQDYLGAVQAYEAVRRNLDNSAASAIPVQQQEQEQQLREHMESFVALKALNVGDVVTVDPWYPHALQHGVRVVELQTPTYERLIISFAQKVLTQDHWDSAQAIAQMSLETPPAQQPKKADEHLLIADYSDFKAWQVQLEPGQSLSLLHSTPYAVAIGITGVTTVGKLSLNPEQAAFIPGSALPSSLHNASTNPAQIVIGGPSNMKLN